MPKIQYEEHKFRESTMVTIRQADEIIRVYSAQGYNLTLRQLYYQFVSRDLIKNSQKEYSRLGDIVSKARRAGLIDWNAIVDRTRNLQRLPFWGTPGEIIAASASQFRYDRWAEQSAYVEVWFEKDALMGVFERPANQLRLPFFSCRGYTSDSEIWGAARRLRQMQNLGKDVIVLHFGDHDPSGIDMSRDIADRLRLFGASRVDVRRLALTMDQVQQYDPPPNPAKETDSRFAEYQSNYGDESWELDALEPTVLAALVTDELDTIIERGQWDEDIRLEKQARAELSMLSDNYDAIVKMASKKFKIEVVDDDDLDEDEDEG